MKISDIDYYFDGGTAAIHTDEGEYYVDRRLGEDLTHLEIFTEYPTEDSISVQKIKIAELVCALNEFSPTPTNFATPESVSLLVEELIDHHNI